MQNFVTVTLLRHDLLRHKYFRISLLPHFERDLRHEGATSNLTTNLRCGKDRSFRKSNRIWAILIFSCGKMRIFFRVVWPSRCLRATFETRMASREARRVDQHGTKGRVRAGAFYQ